MDDLPLPPRHNYLPALTEPKTTTTPPPRRGRPPKVAEPLTMTSKEISELTGKEHKHVLADVRKMLGDLGLTSAEFSADLPDNYGRLQPAFVLPKDLTLTLVSGYDVVMRHRIVTRWLELEGPGAVSPTKSRSKPVLKVTRDGASIELSGLGEAAVTALVRDLFCGR